jgi:hypothetical protein
MSISERELSFERAPVPGTAFAYSAVLVPGFIVHALCVWSAYHSAREWLGY